MEEAVNGQYVTSKGTIGKNPLYFGIYSPLMNFCYDTNATNGGPIVPYDLWFDCDGEDDYDVYEYLVGGYMEDYYATRIKKDMYPSF